ncbi:MAG: protein-S-isoprenylcysteine O-methyltransferase [Pseudomonadota bacterium]
MTLFARGVVMLLFLALCGVVLWRAPVNGWGSVVWLASALLMTIIRAPFAAQNRQNKISERFSVLPERVLLFLVAVGATLLPFLHLTTGALSFADYDAKHWAPFIGAGLLVPGLWVFWKSHADLGRNWSVTTELREDHALIDHGIYKRIRHPMYLGIWLIFAAYPFLIQNWIVGPAALAAFAIMYFIRVPIEEAMMRRQFGIDYDAYCARTGRLLPRFRRRSTPED